MSESDHRAAVARGDPDEAPAAALDLGVLMEDRGDFDEAEALYRLAAGSDHPDVSPMARRNLGLTLLAMGRFGEAEVAFREVVAGGHPDAGPLAAVSLAGLLVDLERLDEAEAVYRSVLDSSDPEVAGVAAVSLGRVYVKRDKLDDAVAAFRVAADGDHETSRAAGLSNLGGVLARLGRQDEAEAAYRAAMEGRDPTFAPLAANSLGALLKDDGRLAEAEEPLRFAVDSGVAHVVGTAATNLGVVLRDLGRLDEAEAVFGTAVEHRDAAAAIALGDLHRSRGRLREAAEMYRLVAESGVASAFVAAAKLDALDGEPGGTGATQLTDSDAIVSALRRRKAAFAVLHRGRRLGSYVLSGDVSVAAWFGTPSPPRGDDIVSDMPARAPDVLVLDTLPPELAGSLAMKPTVLFEDDRLARTGWQADTQMRYLHGGVLRPEPAATFEREALAEAMRPPGHRGTGPLIDATRQDLRVLQRYTTDDLERMRGGASEIDAVTRTFVTVALRVQRLGYHVLAAEGWEPPTASGRVANRLARHGFVPETTAETLSSTMAAVIMLISPFTPPELRVELCFGHDYVATMAQFTDAVEAWAA